MPGSRFLSEPADLNVFHNLLAFYVCSGGLHRFRIVQKIVLLRAYPLSQMNLKFQVTASSLSDEDLLDRIENRQIYLPETIEASIAELQNRGHIFTETELFVFEEDLQAHRENASVTGRRIGFANSTYKNNIVQDPDAPSFYSRSAIYGFTVFFGALFGSVLMAINVNKTKEPVNVIWIMLFGGVFTALQIAIAEFAHTTSSLNILFGIISAYILETFFWNRFIGNSTFYRAKQIWVPLIIGLAFLALFVFALIYADSQPA